MIGLRHNLVAQKSRGWKSTASVAVRAGSMLAVAFALLLAFVARPACALVPMDRGTVDPEAGLQTRGLIDKTNAALPLDIELADEDGHKVKLGDYFHADRPVVIALVYYQCPNLCGIVLNDLTQTVKRLKTLELGKQYEIVAVSFDPKEKPDLAKAKKSKFLNLVAAPGDDARKQVDGGWRFLTGPDESVRKLADAVGFSYQWNEAGAQYFHPSAIFICTPDGRLSRVIPGVGYQHDDTIDLVRDSLVNASAGKIGSPVLRAALFCGAMKFNAATGRYEQNPWVYAGTVGGVLTLVGMGLLARWMWRVEKNRRHEAGPVAG